MKEKIFNILQNIKPGIDYKNETMLVDSRILDSLSIIALVGELCCEFEIEIDVMDLTPDNFNSVDAIVNLVVKLKD